MGHADQADQARSRAQVWKLRNSASRWEAVKILLLGRRSEPAPREQITSEQTLERAKGVRKEGEAGAKLMDISVQTVGVRELDDFETAFKAMNDKLVADYS
jgi:hypothetical protein